jgi:hypothetical protein
MEVSRSLKTVCLAVVTSAAGAVLVQACGGGDNATAQSATDPIIGVWESAVTQKDCTSGATVATFRGAQVFHAGGTLTDTNSTAPSTRSVGMGVWVKGSDNYTATFRFYRYNADGSLAGTNVVTRTVTLSADGNSATASTSLKVLDTAGNTLQSGCASDTATRFH